MCTWDNWPGCPPGRHRALPRPLQAPGALPASGHASASALDSGALETLLPARGSLPGAPLPMPCDPHPGSACGSSADTSVSCSSLNGPWAPGGGGGEGGQRSLPPCGRRPHLGLQEAAVGGVGGASPLPLLAFALDFCKADAGSPSFPPRSHHGPAVTQPVCTAPMPGARSRPGSPGIAPTPTPGRQDMPTGLRLEGTVGREVAGVRDLS